MKKSHYLKEKNKTKTLSQNPTNITQSLLSLLSISVRQIYIHVLAVRQCSYLAKWYTLWVYWPFVRGGPPGVRGSRGLSGG